jgi:drug/metabolite transporter, DME family
VRPAIASILVLLEPLTATVLAGLIFGERLGVVGIIGGGMLLAAILILYAGRSRERSTATST